MAVQTDRFKSIIENAKDIPTLSSVVSRLNEMVKNPSTCAADVGELISKDPSLTAKTLKLVNSSFYGFPKKINSITHAIVILGFNKVKNIALTASILQTFGKGKDFDFQGFWEHSIGTGIAAEIIAKSIGSPYEDDAFVAGLLHDIGKVILSQYFREEASQVFALIAEKDLLMFKAEEEILGFNHCLIGQWMAEKWNFPESLVTSIRMHHTPTMARGHRDLVFVIHAADIFTRALLIGTGGDNKIPELSVEVWSQLKFSASGVEKIMRDILSSIKKAGDFFAMVNE